MRVAGRPYPRIILGGDKFLDYWGPQARPELSTVDGVFKVMDSAYQLGVKGFDISLNSHVINAYQRLKQLHPDVIAIGNPNWRCDIKLGDNLVCDLAPRFRKTLLDRVFTPQQVEAVNQLSPKRRRRWFDADEDVRILSETEVADIHLDEPMYRAKLDQLAGVVDFALIGTDYADWLIPLGRIDVLSRMVKIVREYGFTPISVSHWASITLPVLDQMEFVGHWVYLNNQEQLLSSAEAEAAIRRAEQPITAFRVLAGGAAVNDVESAIEYLKDVGVQSIVIGADDSSQLAESVPVIKRALGLG